MEETTAVMRKMTMTFEMIIIRLDEDGPGTKHLVLVAVPVDNPECSAIPYHFLCGLAHFSHTSGKTALPTQADMVLAGP